MNFILFSHFHFHFTFLSIIFNLGLKFSVISYVTVTNCHMMLHVVVAITCRNSTCDMLTSAKLSVGYLVVGITRELDKKPLLHCYPIYISYR